MFSTISSPANSPNLRQSGHRKAVELQSPQGPVVRMDGREVIMLSSNNYLGLANHPAVMTAAKAGVDRFGMGTASVRFITGA